MHTVTRINVSKRNPKRRLVHLDGRFAFACTANVVEKFKIEPGREMSDAQLAQVNQGIVKQECLDAALRILQRRLHSSSELRTRLRRKEFTDETITTAIEDLARLGYVDDTKFAETMANSAAKHRQHGRNRAMVELLKKGVAHETARSAVNDVYESTDSLAIARKLAGKQAARLRKLDPVVARRRLAGMLARRGFEYDVVKPVIDETLGYDDARPTE